MRTAMRDVAERAGVSSASVSRVLAGKPHVSDEMRQRVMAAVEALAYRPNRVARSLRREKSQILGLIISDIENPFFTSLVRAVEDVGYDHGYGVFLCNSDEDAEKESLYVDLMCAERVAGVVITPTCETNSPCRKLVELNVPVVCADRRLTDLEVDSVVIDNSAVAFEIICHLINHGHRRIAAVMGPMTTTTGRERQEGYDKALKEHGLVILSHLVKSGLPKEQFGYESTKEFLDLADPPTALFVGNNLLTMGALRAIMEKGLRVPEDITVASFDLMDWMRVVETGLIVVAQPTYRLGRTAAQLLVGRIDGDTRLPQEIVLKATVVYSSPAQTTSAMRTFGSVTVRDQA